MVGPRPVLPHARDVIVDAGDHYVTGGFSWLPPSVQFDAVDVAKNADAPAVIAARSNPAVQGFLVWSRFPHWTLTREPDGLHVTVGDLRFSSVRRLTGRNTFEVDTVVER
jgi:hypothetical protein